MSESPEHGSTPSSRLATAGEKVFYGLLGLVVIGLVGYGLHIRFGTPGSGKRQLKPVRKEWSIPESWQAVPGLLYRGQKQKAEELIAGEDTAIDRPPEQLYLLGLLAGYFNDTETCRNLLARASRDQPASITDVGYQLIESKLDALNLSKEDLYRTTLDSEDAQFIAHAFIYRCIAETVLDNIPVGVEQAEALVAWTRRMVAPFEPDPYNVLPVVILARGFGECDRVCWAMLAIARQKGIRGFMVYLFDADQTQPVHTLCQIFPGGVPVLCDPVHGIVFRGSNGEPLDLYRVQKDPVVLKKYAPYAGPLGRCFQHAVLRCWPGEAQAVFIRMKFLQAYANRLPLAPCLFQDLDEEMGFLRRYLFELPGGRQVHQRFDPDLAEYPFSVRTSFRDPNHADYVARYMQYYKSIAQARLLHLQGRFDLAERGYAEVLRSEQPPETMELAAMFHAECLYELGRFAESRREITAFLQTYPESLWTDQIHYYLDLLDRSPHSAPEDLPSASGVVKSEQHANTQ